MAKLRRNFERFCSRNSSVGIPNLMLFIAIGNAIVYLFSLVDPSNILYSVLCFSRSAILHGQVWRLISYIFVPTEYMGSGGFGILLLAIMLFFYYQIGRMLEYNWGVLKFNLFYLTGIVIMDIAALILKVNITNYYIDLSLILSFATLYPDNRVLLFMIIPIRFKYLAWFYFAYTIWSMITSSFPAMLFPIFALANYFLFFGSDVIDILPEFMKGHHTRQHSYGGFRPSSRKNPNAGGAHFFTGKKQNGPGAKPNQNWANGYKNSSGEKPYRHKCTVCGRTDTDYPDLEFRYCSRCNGYYCYCMDHINNHAHIQ